ncbi:hypothetical protein HOA55_01550 [archaeon]|jgi:hypothetical protein|nr:hypothetical protein [archaeon]MBT6820019.1 hypothetical protein [archaeon]MBT7238675.1 hypothetical protein [archaeon]MBT7567810.1 hypothetical protein [archaeon]
MEKKEELKKTIGRLKDIIINKFENKGLISLYLSGTILTRDRVKESDIDFFGFVDKKFNIKKEEEKINKFFDKNRKKLSGRIECRFRAIGTDEFSGRVKRGNLSRYMGVRGLAVTFPFWKFIWGKRINYTNYVKPYTLSYRKKNAIGRIKFMIAEIKKGHNHFIQNFSKEILRLSGIENEIINKENYEHYYSKIEGKFKRNKNHISHEAMRLRKKRVSRKEIIMFFSRVEEYLKYMGSLK